LLQHNVPRLLGFTDVPQPEAGFTPGGTMLQPAAGPVRPVILLAVYSAVVVAIAYAMLRSRDVT
jgi:hypothetical protein